jgi:glycosyltransferase involved in cell wall biosynthesis
LDSDSAKLDQYMVKSSLRVALVALGSPYVRGSWSGIPYFALKEVERRFEHVHVIDTPIVDEWLRRLSWLARLGILLSREPLVSKLFGLYVARQLDAAKPDFVISIGAAHKLAYLRRSWPIVHVADGFYRQIIDFYPKYQPLGKRARRLGDRIQRALFERCALVMPTSDWAANCAINDYSVAPERVMVTPIGANLDSFPAPPVLRANTAPLKLLFAGYDWNRKGGQLVLETFRLLRERYDDAELHIVGCNPAITERNVTVYGRLAKSALEELYRRASFFFMPSRQEAFGLVYCEAAAFGLPSVATQTGGVGTIITDHSNGLLLPLEATAEEYAAAILDVWEDELAYAKMQYAARDAFVKRLNWAKWGDVLVERLTSMHAS